MFSTNTTDNRVVRRVKANWETSDAKGEISSEEITVEYYGLTVAEVRANQAEFERLTKEKKSWFISDTLFKRIFRLNGEPITLEWLENQDVKNLRAVEEAIEGDENPKKL